MLTFPLPPSVAAPLLARAMRVLGGPGSGWTAENGHVPGAVNRPHGDVVAKSKYGHIEIVKRADGTVAYLGRRKSGENVGTFSKVDSAKDALRAPTSTQHFPSGYRRPDVEWRHLAFNEDQSRDERGRWSPEGGGGRGMGGGIHSRIGGGTSLADPKITFGDVPVPMADYSAYLTAHGHEMTLAPEQPELGPQKQCFMNATQYVLGHAGTQYAEGIAYSPKVGTEAGFLHAWVVNKDGQVIDPTWGQLPGAKYFGVVYPEKAYLAHIMQTKMYGVFGGKSSVAKRVLAKGGL